MDLWAPVIFYSPSVYIDSSKEEISINKEEDSGFNLDFFFSDEAKIEGTGKEIEVELEKKAKNSKRKTANPTEVPVEVINANKSTSMTSTSEMPYINTYAETDNLTRGMIIQIDQLNNQINEDISKIRSSASMKGKYTYITNLTSASASLMSTKLNAIKELNNSITQSHNLELKRAKDLKTFELEKQNDDARMMDLYSAFINAPMGMYDNKLNMPTIPNMMIGVNDPNSGVQGVAMGGNVSSNGQVSPEQMRMRMEGNNNIEEIVVFDPASGRKWFDVIDKATGQSIPNYPRSDAFLLDDISIESRAGIAKNRNLDKIWPLQIVGNTNISEY